MATTYKLITKNVLASDVASVTLSAIPSTFTDLRLVASVRAGNSLLYLEFNGTASGYNDCHIEGSTAIMQSYAYASQPSMILGAVSTTSQTSNSFGYIEAHIPEYASSRQKVLLGVGVQETNSNPAYTVVTAGRWASTAAITSIKLTPGAGNLITGSTFYLYGITKA